MFRFYSNALHNQKPTALLFTMMYVHDSITTLNKKGGHPTTAARQWSVRP